MDEYAEFQQFAKTIADERLEQTRASGLPPQSWKDDSGLEKEGWRFENLDHTIHRESTWRGQGDFYESWGNACIFLSTEGEFFEYRFTGEETPSGTSLKHSLRKLTAGEMVGSSGEPFEEWTQKLRRYRYAGR